MQNGLHLCTCAICTSNTSLTFYLESDTFFFQINNSDNALHFCNSGMKVNTIHSASDMPSSNLWNNYDHIWAMSIPYTSDLSSSNTSWQCCCNSCRLYRLNIFKDRQFVPDKCIKNKMQLFGAHFHHVTFAVGIGLVMKEFCTSNLYSQSVNPRKIICTESLSKSV